MPHATLSLLIYPRHMEPSIQVHVWIFTEWLCDWMQITNKRGSPDVHNVKLLGLAHANCATWSWNVSLKVGILFAAVYISYRQVIEKFVLRLKWTDVHINFFIKTLRISWHMLFFINICPSRLVPRKAYLNRWSLRIDKKFHHTIYWACDYLSMLVLKLIHVSKRDPYKGWC